MLFMHPPPKIALYVAGTGIAGVLTWMATWRVSTPYPGAWPLASFILIAILLDRSSSKLRVDATGSLSFLMYLSAAVLFGGFWGGLVAGSSVLISQALAGRPAVRIVFNASQHVLSIAAAFLCYRILGGGLPPAYLTESSHLPLEAARTDFGLFFISAGIYFGINSIAVSGAVSLTSGRPFREVWTLNTRGVIGYDLGASLGALLIAWLYTESEQLLGFGPWGLLGVIIPILVVRHVYGMYHQLQSSSQELLELMVKAIEARDPYTSGHSLRVRALSRAVALELGLATHEVEQIEIAALLHDVGKIHEEFAPILRKEGRLTSDETALMQTHSAKSAELVGVISKFRGFIQDSVRHHHERWDGQGYPSGLKGKDIPLGARIILLADTIDAMTTDRPYRKRLGLDVVIAELQRCKGTQFESELVDVAVSSVAVRRLIVNPVSSAPTEQPGEPKAASAQRSKRVSWPASLLWPARRA